jgi:N-acyl-D-aspartate/D-glutamate deacylase
MAADLVAFDPDRVRERSTYADPTHYSEGIPFVMVNGACRGRRPHHRRAAPAAS